MCAEEKEEDKKQTFEEFQKEFLAAHDCDKCRGKIVGVMVDKIGNMYCGYCKEKVPYPRPTKEDLMRWFKDEEWIEEI